jgi:hypothetical protein
MSLFSLRILFEIRLRIYWGYSRDSSWNVLELHVSSPVCVLDRKRLGYSQLQNLITRVLSS